MALMMPRTAKAQQTLTVCDGTNYDESSLNNITFKQHNFIPKTTFTYEPKCDTPTSLAVNDITSNSATVSWEGNAESYTVRYADLPTSSNSKADQSRDGWYYYDNGILNTCWGAQTDLFWGVMFPAGTYSGNVLKKIALYEESSVHTKPITVYVYNGGETAPDNLLYTEEFDVVAADSFHEVTLATPVEIDQNQNLWVILHSADDYPASTCYSSNETDANSRWCSLDGSSWFNLTDVGGDNHCAFMVRAYTEFIWTTIDNITTNEYEITGLNAHTPYVAQVRADCGSGVDSEWATTYFTTLAPCLTPTALNATDYSAYTVTLDWTENGYATEWDIEVTGPTTYIVNATTKPYTVDGLAGNTTYSFKVRARCSDTYFSEWSSPLVVTTDIPCLVPTDLQITNVTASSATLSWTAGYLETEWDIEVTGPTTYIVNATTKPYTVDGLAGNTTYSFKVRARCSDTYFSEWSSPLVVTTDIPCITPTDLQITDVTASSATLSWTAGYLQTDWTVKYKKSYETEWTEEQVSGTPAVTLTGLESLTTYNVKVYRCEEYVSDNFITKAIFPYEQDFSGDGIPTGWSQYYGLLDEVMAGTALSYTYDIWANGTSNDVLDGNHLYVNIYDSDFWIVAPAIPMPAGARLTFDVAYTAFEGTAVSPMQDGDDDKFVVLASTDDMATWTILRQWDNAGSEYVLNDLTPETLTLSFDLSAYAGTNLIIAFYAESTEYNADNNIHIDNVVYELKPSCEKPTNVAVNNISGTTATVSFNSDAEAWNLDVNGNVTAITTNPYTIEGLELGTTYNVKVQADCGSSTSNWSNAVSFSTDCCMPEDMCELTFVLNDSYGDGWNGNAIQVVDVETNIVLATMAADDHGDDDVASTDIKYLSVCDGREITFLWVKGSYPEEASWVITDVNGDEITSGTGSDSMSTGDVLATYTVDCAVNTCVIIPTNLDATTILHTSAFVNWDGYQTEYNVQWIMPEQDETFLSQDFENGMNGWQAISNNTDNIIGIYDNAAHNGNYGFAFSSFESADDYNQYLISPKITTTGTLQFYYRNDYVGEEVFKIGYSSTTNNLDAFTWGDEVQSTNYTEWTLLTEEIPSGTKYFAIHYYSDYLYSLYIDDIAITGEHISAGTLQVANNVTAPYEITGLTANRLYQWQVQGICESANVTGWASGSFTTYPDDKHLAYLDGGSWNDPDTWAEDEVPAAGADVIIFGDIIIPNGYVANAASIIIEEDGSLTIQDGGQLIHDNTVEATLQKNITGYGDSDGGWYLIASPVDNLSTSAVTTGTYDLFVYNEPNAYWYSNTGTGAPFNTLERGKGYLYANAANQTLNFAGEMVGSETPDFSVDLSYECDAYPDLKGYNLLGNPFSRNLVNGDLKIGGTAVTSVLLLNNDEDYQVCNFLESGTIKPGQGFFIQATAENQKLVFNPSSKDENAIGFISIKAGDENYIDKAYIQIGGGNTLRKLSFYGDKPSVYVMNEGDDFAATTIYELAGSMPVNFKAVEDGEYKITINAKNIEPNMMILFDDFTGEEFDLLESPTYHFKAEANDPENRFKLIFDLNNNYTGVDENYTGDIFVYQNGDEIIVNGEGELKVFDVLGRLVSQKHINGVETYGRTSLPTGVYIFKLNENTQKVIIK